MYFGFVRPSYYFTWTQQGEPFQPQTGFLSLSVPELPRLYNLRVIPSYQIKGIVMGDGVLDCNFTGRAAQYSSKESSSSTHISPKITLV